MKKISIDGKSLTLEQVTSVAFDLSARAKIDLTPSSKKLVLASREFIERKLSSKEPIYGVNTGFGLLSKVQIDKGKLDELQVNLLRSHAVGVGRPLSEQEVRAAILLRANTLAAGFSGVTHELIQALLNLLNRSVHPWIPEQGSVGACGDLAPLAHLSLVLIGEGKAYYKGRLMPGSAALKAAGLNPYKLKAKEGLSLINGTQIMTAIGALTLMKAKKLARLSNLAGAMSLEAVEASDAPFDPLVHQIRPHKGQIAVAQEFRRLLKKSEIMHSHKDCDKVQDPYSFRCIPQVHGIAIDVIENVEKVLKVEINSVTDNPLVFVSGKNGRIVNAGNFHGEYVAISMDELAIAVSELANISEQRIEKLMNPSFSGLPAFLAKNGGLNSGFMIVQVAAASLVSENKVLAHPASVDSIPTSADKEDHVSMGTIAARKARAIVDNTWNVIAMELLTAAQGLDFRRPLKPATLINKAYTNIRKKIRHADKDRAFHEDIEKMAQIMMTAELDV